MKFYLVIIFTLLLFFPLTDCIAQTSGEIQQMLEGSSEDAKGKKEKVETETETIESEVIETKEVVEEKIEAAPKLSFKKLLKNGDKLFEQGSFYNAYDDYKSALSLTQKKKKQRYLNHQLGYSNLYMRDYEGAIKHFGTTIDLDKKGKYPLATYELANSYKYIGQYDTAKGLYRSFLSNVESSSKMDYEKKRTRLEMKGCSYGDSLIVIEPKFEVENAGLEVNGPFAEFGPSILGNDLIFSKIKSDEAIMLIDERPEEYFARLYSATMSKGAHMEAVVFADDLNEKEVYVGNPSFNANGDEMYYTRCQLVQEMNTSCQVYLSTFQNGKWTEGTKLGANINSNGSTNTQPHMSVNSEGQEVLYFVSDRSSGRGGKDIWYSVKKDDGTFDIAKNLGYPMNTRYDELSPFFNTSDNIFYFSSNGHVSLGGFDIFSVKQDEDGEWLDVENMATPLNSSFDEYDFVLNENQDIGYLVSNRIGSVSMRNPNCCDDIFKVVPANVEIYVTGVVYASNAGLKTIAKSADVVLISDNDLAKDNFKGAPFLFKLEENSSYTLTAKNDLFERVEVPFNTNGITSSDTIQKDLILVDRKIEDNYVFGTIYYEYDVPKLRSDAPDTLRKVVSFMQAYPKTIVEVAAHTDSKGQEDYNLELSKQRSQAALNYVKSQGIAEERLIAKWYGESDPAEPNTKDNGSDNPEGRALNRRTEFKIIGKLEE